VTHTSVFHDPGNRDQEDSEYKEHKAPIQLHSDLDVNEMCVGSTPTAGNWILLHWNMEILFGGLANPTFDTQIRKPLEVLGIAGD
jgi:hypothetical protein